MCVACGAVSSCDASTLQRLLRPVPLCITRLHICRPPASSGTPATVRTAVLLLLTERAKNVPCRTDSRSAQRAIVYLDSPRQRLHYQFRWVNHFYPIREIKRKRTNPPICGVNASHVGHGTEVDRYHNASAGTRARQVKDF